MAAAPVLAGGVSTQRLRHAEILAVGSELLTPFRTDTNSLHLTACLNELGIEVRGKAVVPDDRDAIVAALREALLRADVVITTGGLGPTDDDVTCAAVAAVAGVVCDEDAGILTQIEARFERRGWRMPPINRKQAQVPRGALALPNPLGTAPGLWCEIGPRVVVCLPGPPRELKPMFDAEVAPRLRARCGSVVLRRRVVKVAGRGESHVEELAQPVYGPWRNQDPPITTTILAAPGLVELHLSAQGEDASALDRALETAVGALQAALGRVVFSVDGRTLEEVVGAILRERHLTIAAAESCTGGLLMGALTDVPGSSGWLSGGVVAYANDVKVQFLNIPAGLIAEHGAVSEPVAVAMAEGVRARCGADVGVGITGIAGPAGGSDAKPVGTVVLAVAGPGDRRVVRTVGLPGDRILVRTLAVRSALELIRRVLTDADYN